jgi:hypothetical protein
VLRTGDVQFVGHSEVVWFISDVTFIACASTDLYKADLPVTPGSEAAGTLPAWFRGSARG